MTRVFVSGCYDIVHAGHIQFFREARALGDHLTVCFASAEVLWLHKRRRSSLPDDHKRALLAALTRPESKAARDRRSREAGFALLSLLAGRPAGEGRNNAPNP